MNRPIVLMRPYVTDAMRAAVQATLHSRYIGQGPRVEELEKRVSERYGNRPSVAVGSGTDALHLSYILAGISRGMEVLTPLFSCTATSIPLLWMGARLRFYDVSPNSLNADMRDIDNLITEHTGAVVLVHYGGSAPHHYNHRFNRPVVVIEDAAQAMGALLSDGNADYTTFSMQAVKTVSTPDGGIMLIPSNKLAEARRRRWFGIDREAKLAGTWANDITEVGWKYQLNDVAAAMALASLDSLENQIIYRHAMLSLYSRLLAKVSGIKVIDTSLRGSAWLCTVLADNRDGLKRKLAEHGIESDQVHYRNDRYTVFAAYRQPPGSFPNMDAIESKYLVLPLHMGMELGDVGRVCSVISEGW